MSTSFAVEPLPGSYVDEWVAVCYEGPSEFGAVKRLLKGTSWVTQLDLDNGSAVITRVHQYGVDQWTMNAGDYLVKSPHDKVWVMGPVEYRANFREAP